MNFQFGMEYFNNSMKDLKGQKIGGIHLKAIVITEYGNPEVMKYVDNDIPRIKPTQVLIRVE